MIHLILWLISLFVVRVINVSNEKLYETIMKETDGLGVDHIYEISPIANISGNPITKQEIVKCLAVHGRWATPSCDLQVSTILLTFVHGV
jgi:threonine dehydrogenase-like Zn-dependent dehydrogenase